MQLADFLDFDAIKTSLSGGNKRSLLQQLANLAAQRLGVDAALILASLTEREQLGSTGFGQGVAIPHGKIDGLGRIYCLFARLERTDRLQGDRRPSGRSRLSAPVTRRRGRRASEGAGGDQPRDAQCARRSKKCAARAAAMHWPLCCWARTSATRPETSSMTADRLPAHVEVGGILRRAEAAGGFGTVLRKGDPDRGSLLADDQQPRGRHVACLERVLALDGGYAWQRSGPAEFGEFRRNCAISSLGGHGSTKICGLWNWISRTPERFIAETTATG